MNKLQLIEITTDELQELINNAIKSEFDKLKNHFQPVEPEYYLTRTEVANLLKINITTLWNWTKKGRLKSYGIGERVYYKRKEIENSIILINS
jgi:excisionase family DNA binding protein